MDFRLIFAFQDGEAVPKKVKHLQKKGKHLQKKGKYFQKKRPSKRKIPLARPFNKLKFAGPFLCETGLRCFVKLTKFSLMISRFKPPVQGLLTRDASFVAGNTIGKAFFDQVPFRS